MKTRLMVIIGICVGIFLVAGIIFYSVNYFYGGEIAFNRKVIVLDNSDLLAVAKLLPAQGILELKSNHNVSLKVSDRYIETLYPLIVSSLNSKRRQCLTVPLTEDNHQAAAHITLHMKLDNQKFFFYAKSPFDFIVNQYINAIIFKKIHGILVKETWYELAVSAPGLVTSLKDLPDPASLHISLAVKRTRVDNGHCYQPPPLLIRWLIK
jgi:hypothetical protein